MSNGKEMVDTTELKKRYPKSQQVKAGFPPHADIEPWVHIEKPITDLRLFDLGEALEDPMAESNGHKKTLGVCRELYDEVAYLRATLDAFIIQGYPNVKMYNDRGLSDVELPPGRMCMTEGERTLRERHPLLFEGPFEPEKD